MNASAGRRPLCRRTSAVHPIPAAQVAEIAAPRCPVCCRDREFGGRSRATAIAAEPTSVQIARVARAMPACCFHHLETLGIELA